jgi:hypothetical protein
MGLVLPLVVVMSSAGCGSSDEPSITCAQSLSDYCKQAGSVCVQHIVPSSNVVTTETSFCSQCGAPCSTNKYSFENCADGTLGVVTEVGASTTSKGLEFLTYLYDAETLNLSAVVDSTSGGTYKASLTCLGGAQTLANHGACAPSLSLSAFQCP